MTPDRNVSVSPSPPERDTQIDLMCVDLPFSAEQLFNIQIGGYARALSHVGSHAM
jgi:hypothetical protein